MQLSLRRSQTSLWYLEQSHVGLQKHTLDLKKVCNKIWAMQAVCKLTESKSILADCPAPPQAAYLSHGITALSGRVKQKQQTSYRSGIHAVLYMCIHSRQAKQLDSYHV